MKKKFSLLFIGISLVFLSSFLYAQDKEKIRSFKIDSINPDYLVTLGDLKPVIPGSALYEKQKIIDCLDKEIKVGNKKSRQFHEVLSYRLMYFAFMEDAIVLPGEGKLLTNKIKELFKKSGSNDMFYFSVTFKNENSTEDSQTLIIKIK